MRFLHPDHDEALELSLDDVFLLPGYFEGSSRLDVELRPVDFAGGSHPIVSANMNAVTGKRMAETMARLGGLGVLPQDMDLETAARIIKHIKAADPRYDTPLSVSPRATLRDVLGIIRKRAHDMVVVVDDERRPLGIVTHADLRDRDQYSPVGSFMSSRLVTIPVGTPNRDAFLLMEEQRVKAAPVLDADGPARGRADARRRGAARAPRARRSTRGASSWWRRPSGSPPRPAPSAARARRAGRLGDRARHRARAPAPHARGDPRGAARRRRPRCRSSRGTSARRRAPAT